MPKTNVLVNFIQDRSGSMSSVWAETLSGFKTFVEDLQQKGKEGDIEYLFSLTVFDTVIDMPLVGVPIADVNVDKLKAYPPRGATALFDAVGSTLDAIDKNATAKSAEKIICVIVTDGFNNSSREWTKDALNQAISDRLDLGNWTFTYLGTQPETWDESMSIGLSMGATAGYQGAMAAATYSTVSDAVHNLSRSADSQSRALFTSKHASSRRIQAAGMSVKPDVKSKTMAPPRPPKPPKKKPAPAGGGKWR